MISHEGWANQIDAFDASSAGIEKVRAQATRLGLDNIDSDMCFGICRHKAHGPWPKDYDLRTMT